MKASANKPVPDARVERLFEALGAKGYRRMREVGLGRDGEYMTWWAGPSSVIVHEYGGGNGFDVYFVDPSSTVDATIQAIPE